MATPHTFVATTIGRVAVPKLADTLVRTGADKFIKQYGQRAFEAVLGTAVGARAYSKTEEYITEYLNYIDNGGDENSFVPKGSMPTATRAEQMDAMMAVPDTTHKSVTDTPSGLVIGGEKKEPLPPPEPFTTPADPQEPTILSTPEAEKQDTTLITPEPKKIDTTLSTPIPKESGPIIYTKDDISKQTKELVPEKPEFGKLTKTEKQTAKALKEDKSDFYSRAVDAIKNAKQNKFTKGKWKSIVQSNSTKDEMDYLGLTEYLKGNESITKEELLKFVEKKDIAPNITVRSIPKDEMNKQYESYSLGGDNVGTQEHIVFQFGRIPSAKELFIDRPYEAEVTPLFKSEHFDTEYGTNTFAHARVQVGYSPADAIVDKFGYNPNLEEDLEKTDNINTSKLFNNTLIIDEIQSDYIQRGQDKGFIGDFDIVPEDKLIEYLEKNNIFYKLSKPPFADKESGVEVIEWQQSGPIKPGDAPKMDTLNVGYDKNFIFNKSDKTHYVTTGEDINPVQYLTDEGIVPDFPIKESKKFVELVLNKMIEKAVLDGRDSIAITNGQIQANRYDAMDEEDKKGLKKFYDEIVFKQLEKIAKKYNVKLERIDITEGEAPKELQDAHLDNQIKRAQDDGFVLKKVNLQFLFDRTMDTNIPGHASIYSDRGVGQGRNYIEDYLNELVDNRPFSPATGTGSGLDKWNEIRNNEVYIWIEERDISRDRIGWELPIVPVQDVANYTPELRSTTATVEKILKDQYKSTDVNDLESYTKYLKSIEPPKGEEIGPEQLIKMKLPKKLQKERLSKPIKLTKAKQQTDRLFA